MEHAEDNNFWSRLTFGFVNCVLRKACQGPLTQEDAQRLFPPAMTIEKMANAFKDAYARTKGADSRRGRSSNPARNPSARGGRPAAAGEGTSNHTYAESPWCSALFRTLLRLHWRALLMQQLLCLGEVAQALVTPVLLREFLRWIEDGNENGGGPLWRGWVLAAALGLSAISIPLMLHHHISIGIRAGLCMRQQLVASIHAKALRLTTSGLAPDVSGAKLSSGYVSTLIGADMRRFDYMQYWPYLVASPLQLVAVIVMVGLQLDFVSAAAGIALSLAVIPLQGVLAQFISHLRLARAHWTDVRVRMMTEAVEGHLALKICSLEDAFERRITQLRNHEVMYVRRASRIRALNLALFTSVSAIVAFVTFSIHRLRDGSLDVAGVFYTLSLLQLPASYLVHNFVTGVQYTSELGVSLRRIQAFLSLPEPSISPGLQTTVSKRAFGTKTASRRVLRSKKGFLASRVQSAELGQLPAPAPGLVEMRGGEYDWRWPLGVRGALGLEVEAEEDLWAVEDGDEEQDDDEENVDELKSSSDGVGMDRGCLSKCLRRAVGGGGGDGGCGCDGGLGTSDRRGAGGKDGAGDGGEVGQSEAKSTLSASTVTAAAADCNPVGIGNDGDFGVSEWQRPALRGVRFRLAPGELLGVCGATGSGKSTLLAALLGELQPVQEPGQQATDRSVRSEKSVSRSATSRFSMAQERVAVVEGPVAYCAQIPWITNGSVRDNILFGRPYEEEWYDRVVRACCLEDDLRGLTYGDLTELGESGAGLSGGQKARVALARAIYCRPAVALLDDPLSAVDPRVGRALFDSVLGPRGLLAQCGATRVLVTHQEAYLPECDRVLLLVDGEMAAFGEWRQVEEARASTINFIKAAAVEGVALGSSATDMTSDAYLAEKSRSPPTLTNQASSSARRANLIASVQDPSSVSDPTDPNNPIEPTVDVGGVQIVPEVASTTDTSSAQSLESSASRVTASAATAVAAAAATMTTADTAPVAVNGSEVSPSDCEAVVLVPIVDPEAPFPGHNTESAALRHSVPGFLGPAPARIGSAAGLLLHREDHESGSVAWSVYRKYLRHLGLVLMVIVGAGVLGVEAVYLAADWWLAMWAAADPADQDRPRWQWVYGLLTGLVVITSMTNTVVFFESAVSAADALHRRMTRRVLRAPLPFFHGNPAGRVINRFSKDQGLADDLLPACLCDALNSGMMVLGALVLVAVAVPFVLPLFAVLFAVFFWVRRRYIRASRDVKRWEAVTYSPIYTFVIATVKGLPTIRAYGASSRFHAELLRLMSKSAEWSFVSNGAICWIGLRLDTISAAVLLIAALMSVAVRDMIKHEVLALALTHSLNITTMMQYFVQLTADVENQMTSIERMLVYTELESEPPKVADGGAKPPPEWPRSGRLQFENVIAIYKPGLPPAIRGISFMVPAGCSCGVVGRTGSGKSSLLLTLLRMMEVTRGSIYLDGIDISTLGLDAVRRHIAVIPQDPVLFSGSLRGNLDPWGTHADDDAALWQALRAVQLSVFVRSLPGGLDFHMTAGGSNLSVGQRQLLCLARALVANAKVLALDEATANVDSSTDHAVQASLRAFIESGHESGANGVVLVIAHRLETVMDLDQLLVLAAGKVVESGSPGQLLEKGGNLASMAAAAAMAASIKAQQALPEMESETNAAV